MTCKMVPTACNRSGTVRCILHRKVRKGSYWRFMKMLKLKEFLRQHALWVGLIAVAIPLLAHLWLQYKSLSQLESTLPYQRKAYMRKYLSQVLEKVIVHYEEKAEEVLNVP